MGEMVHEDVVQLRGDFEQLYSYMVEEMKVLCSYFAILKLKHCHNSMHVWASR